MIDQGSQFTSDAFTKVLLGNQISISMDGRGRALDNVLTERLWWTVKYEEVYPKDYADGQTLHHGLERYFAYYNHERNHSALDKKIPAEVFFEQAALSRSWHVTAGYRFHLKFAGQWFKNGGKRNATIS